MARAADLRYEETAAHPWWCGQERRVAHDPVTHVGTAINHYGQTVGKQPLLAQLRVDRWDLVARNGGGGPHVRALVQSGLETMRWHLEQPARRPVPALSGDDVDAVAGFATRPR